MKNFTFYWLTGDREVLEGSTPSDAFTRAGYSAGARRALDFYAEGDDKDYVWNSKTRNWDKRGK